MARHIKHLRSNTVEQSGEPKQPPISKIGYGEIAINYSNGLETLFIRNDNDDIVPFHNGNSVTKEISESHLTNVTYSQLQSLKNQSKLTPGTHYRITDYRTTSSQENTAVANHNFDIIVMALSEDTLSEDAKAIKHEGDTYFENSDLSAWKLKYTVDNDLMRYGWATLGLGISSGRGVIYYMRDEYGNEAPYDFKNIMFKRWKVTSSDGDTTAPYDGRYVGVKLNGTIYPTGYDITDDEDFRYMYTFSGQKAVYDNGITPPQPIGANTEIYDLTTSRMFGFYNEETKPVGCCGNVISVCCDFHQKINRVILNDIVFEGWFIDMDTLPYDYETMYGDTITKMMDCPNDNRFEPNCFLNTFGYGAHDNHFSDVSYCNTFGVECTENEFGMKTVGNVFGDYAEQNTFGSNNSGNIAGESFVNNTFTDNCKDNIFGDHCENNTFGGNCSDNQLMDYNQSIFVGENCKSIAIGNDYVRNITVETENVGVAISTSDTTSSQHWLQNLVIENGVNLDAENVKSIVHPFTDEIYKMKYVSSDTVTISV